jgi:bifunctional UDP-N-acetylglucosamine pyrophosphorylase/glucosamine-1-phosphate N-acetyltransferase
MDKNGNITAVILAAGKGTRMLPLTLNTPKPMLKVGNKNLIELKLEALPDAVTDIIIVIGYLGEQIQDYFGTTWSGKAVRYVSQNELNGTAGAIWAAKDLLEDRFMVMMGDDLYAKEDVSQMLQYEFAICVKEISNREIGGEMILNAEGGFVAIKEAKHFVEQGLMNTGLYMLDRRIFNYSPVAIGGTSTELGLPHTLVSLAKDIHVDIVRASKWMQITAPEDLRTAEDFIKEQY